MKLFFLYTILIFSLLSVVSCGPSRYLPDGDSLYTGAEVKITDTVLSRKQKKLLRSDLVSLTRPKPNKKILGFRYKLFFYGIPGTSKKKKSLARWFQRKFGEPPVLLSDVNLDYNTKVLNSTLQNRGFFYSVTNRFTRPV